ncbi:MAG TPA: hypothetical protein DIT07_04810 [Sphingobacteriaceae bacterium]|nr:hypothetical protein [Sphingobacteriaceae bacterium]
MAEIQKLAQVLARIMDFKNENKYDKAEDLIKKTLTEDFEFGFDDLSVASVTDFEALLKNKNFPSEKLDLLGQFLFESVYPFEDTPETDIMLHKVLLIFRLLEEEHHIQSFDNLSKREMIDKFLNNRQYE